MNWTSEIATSETFLSAGSPIRTRMSDIFPLVPDWTALRLVARGFLSCWRTVSPRS